MKNILFIGCLVFIATSCNSLHSDSKMVLGAPEAIVSSAPNNELEKGPIAYAPIVPSVENSDTVEIKIDARHKIFTVARDYPYAAWVFGDSVPGPVIHVRVGQTIKFSMTDRSIDSMGPMTMALNMQPMQHSWDFHAAMVNPEDKFRSIDPGQTISFLWTANYPGVFMYHCGTPSVLMHLSNGMYGMIIVEPIHGFPSKADTSFALVQSEYYMKQVGSVYTYDTAKALLKQPTFVTFNGKSGQYVVRPLRAKAGQRVRMYLMNAGPNNVTNFHVIGCIFDKVWLDGNPKNELNGMQAVLLGPSSGAVVEFVLPEKGKYTFVDHSFADAEKGAVGMIIAE